MDLWRIIIDKKVRPDLNMGIDFALWKNISEGRSLPVLRFYQWQPSSVSIGYNQKIEDLINVDYCRKNNIWAVRRPTGGSAIFHDIEITYSFSASFCQRSYFLYPFSSYIMVCKAIQKGLQKAGVELKIRGYSQGKEPSYTSRDCFSLSSKHDLVIENKKLVGSAQRRNKNSFLQHGSILIDIRKEIWEKIFKEKVDFSKITCLKDFTADVRIENIINYLKTGFEEVFEVEFEIDTLTEKEKKDSIEFSRKYFKNLLNGG